MFVFGEGITGALVDTGIFNGGMTHTVKNTRVSSLRLGETDSNRLQAHISARCARQNWQIFSLKWGEECVLPECIVRKLLVLVRRKILRVIVPQFTPLEAPAFPYFCK